MAFELQHNFVINPTIISCALEVWKLQFTYFRPKLYKS